MLTGEEISKLTASLKKEYLGDFEDFQMDISKEIVNRLSHLDALMRNLQLVSVCSSGFALCLGKASCMIPDGQDLDDYLKALCEEIKDFRKRFIMQLKASKEDQ